MTPVEDRVRRALADLAPDAPADRTARLGVARAVGRRRRRGLAGGALSTALVAAVLVAVAVAGPRALGRDRAVVPATTVPPAMTVPPMTAVPPATTVPLTTTVPPATSAPPATTVPAAATGERVTFAGVSFEPPRGWVVADRRGDESICVEPSEDPYPNWDCSGLRIDHGHLRGFETDDYVDHGPWGWSHATDVTPCPTGTDPEDVVLPPDDAGYEPIDQGFGWVGDHRATYDRWAAECRLSGFRFEPRGWHLPVSQIVIFEYFDRPETEGILASFTFP
jgi:hypothetical protein